MQNVLVNVNGEIQDWKNAKIHIFDRGFLYGDSLYEVARTYGGHLAFVQEHLDRIKNSAILARLLITQSTDALEKEMERTLRAFQNLPGQKHSEAYCRLIITRGVGKIGFGLSALLSSSQYIIIVQPLELPPQKQLTEGLRLRIVNRLRNDKRALDPAMKSGNYLNNLLAYLEAADEGFDDAVLCNAHGHVTEGTTFNLFYMRSGIIATPPLNIGILDGITRRHVLTIAKSLGIPVREVRFPKERLYEADEVFITSSIKEVFPVKCIDGNTIGKGTPGDTTLKLRSAFQDLVQAHMRKQKRIES